MWFLSIFHIPASKSGGSRHTIVCCVAQENGACVHNVSILTRNTKYDFTPVHSSVNSSLNKTKFAVQVPAYWERTYTRSEVNRTSHSWNTSVQKVAHFHHFFLLFFFGCWYLVGHCTFLKNVLQILKWKEIIHKHNWESNLEPQHATVHPYHWTNGASYSTLKCNMLYYIYNLTHTLTLMLTS